MFRDTGVVKAPDDKMDALESSSGGGSSLNEGRRPRSGSANQDPQQALKCPRCDSTNTKFCYYNNYSTTQPRHFCKSCRRYWTRGGALRNVPVGGGCRKNKRVKQRLMGGVDPEESTSTMLARLNSCTFPSFGCPPNFGDDSGAMLNMAAFSSRLQDSMRLRQQQSSDNSTGTAAADHHASNFFDMGFPAALMNKTCGTGACGGTCGSRTCAGINDTCGGLMNAFENNLNASMGYTTLPVKLEHEAIPYNTNYDLNTCLIDHTRMAGTSATATLASIEDQLSNFSNVPPVDSFNPDQMKVQEQKNFAEQNLPLQLLNHGGPQDSSDHGGLVIADFPLEEKVIMGDKPLINVIGPSLMSAENWQQSVLMNDVLFEPPHNLWGHSRWQDMHALATTTAAGGVL